MKNGTSSIFQFIVYKYYNMLKIVYSVCSIFHGLKRPITPKYMFKNQLKSNRIGKSSKEDAINDKDTSNWSSLKMALKA